MIFLAALWLFAAQTSAKPSSPNRGFTTVSKKADEAREANHLDEAIRLYREAVRLRANWKEGWWYLGTLLYERDRYAEATPAWRRFTVLDPKAGPGWALLGLCEYETKDYEQALIHLERARELGIEENAELRQVALYHAAMLLTRFERYEAALEVVMSLARRGEDSPAMTEAAGIAAMRRPLLPAELPPTERELIMQVGRAVMDTGARRVGPAQKEFEELVTRYPTQPNLHYLFGSFLLASDPDGGLRELRKELEISPGHTPALLQIAFEYLKRGDGASAIPYARKAAEIDAQSFLAHNALGRALVESGDLENGIKQLELSKKLAPDSPQIRIALASAYAKAGRGQDAARERAEFIKLEQMKKQAGGE